MCMEELVGFCGTLETRKEDLSARQKGRRAKEVQEKRARRTNW